MTSPDTRAQCDVTTYHEPHDWMWYDSVYRHCIGIPKPPSLDEFRVGDSLTHRAKGMTSLDTRAEACTCYVVGMGNPVDERRYRLDPKCPVHGEQAEVTQAAGKRVWLAGFNADHLPSETGHYVYTQTKDAFDSRRVKAELASLEARLSAALEASSIAEREREEARRERGQFAKAADLYKERAKAAEQALAQVQAKLAEVRHSLAVDVSTILSIVQVLGKDDEFLGAEDGSMVVHWVSQVQAKAALADRFSTAARFWLLQPVENNEEWETWLREWRQDYDALKPVEEGRPPMCGEHAVGKDKRGYICGLDKGHPGVHAPYFGKVAVEEGR